MDTLYIFIHKETQVIYLTVACCMEAARKKLPEHFTRYNMDAYSIEYMKEHPTALWVRDVETVFL